MSSAPGLNGPLSANQYAFPVLPLQRPSLSCSEDCNDFRELARAARKISNGAPAAMPVLGGDPLPRLLGRLNVTAFPSGSTL
jgi:hypothetical protein